MTEGVSAWMGEGSICALSYVVGGSVLGEYSNVFPEVTAGETASGFNGVLGLKNDSRT